MQPRFMIISIICCAMAFMPAEWRWEQIYHLSRKETAELRTILDVLSFAEGTYAYGDDGYRLIYGGSLFENFDDHPRIVVCLPYRGKPLCATAAGRYQILQRTFDRLGLPDFSPQSQDIAAIKLLAENGIMELLKQSHNFEDIVTRLNKTWATLPGAPYGQPTKAFSVLKNFYLERLAYHQNSRGS
jgi:muramidase (phage lysozyme)